VETKKIEIKVIIWLYKLSVFANIGTRSSILNRTNAANSIVLVDFLIDTKGIAGTRWILYILR